MELGMGIRVLKHFRGIGHLVSPLKLQSRKALYTIFNQINFLLVIGSPKIILLYWARFVK